MIDCGYNGFCKIPALEAEALGLDVEDGAPMSHHTTSSTVIITKYIYNLDVCVGGKSDTGRAVVHGTEIVIGLKFLRGGSIVFDTDDGSLRFLKW